MKRFSLCMALSALVACMWIPSLAGAEVLTGQYIMDQQQSLHEVTTEQSVIRMVLEDGKKKSKPKERTLKLWVKRHDNGLIRALAGLTAPRDLAGTALLTWVADDGKSKQWLFLPSQIVMQRIKGDTRTTPFLGTDFTYEDMEPDYSGDFIFERTDDKTMNGKDYFVVLVSPATKEAERASGYSKRLVWVQQDIKAVVQVEFYDRRGRRMKTLTNHDFRQYGETAWLPERSEMVDLKTGHKTTFYVQKRSVNKPIDDMTFTQEFVKNKGLLLEQ